MKEATSLNCGNGMGASLPTGEGREPVEKTELLTPV